MPFLFVGRFLPPLLRGGLCTPDNSPTAIFGVIQMQLSSVILQVDLHSSGPALQWQQCADLPLGVWGAQAVILRNKVYMGGGETLDKSSGTEYTILIHDITRGSWRSIRSPTRWSALTTYHDQLVLVGGGEASSAKVTNNLWTLQEDEHTFTQTLPPMPTARYGASAVSTDNYLIVAGGRDSNHCNLDVVNVYISPQWMTTDALPKKCCYMKATNHSGYYYLMGGNGQNRSYTYLPSLIAKATQHPLSSPRHSLQQSAWKTLPDVPCEWSSTGIFGGFLVAVGGRDPEGMESSSLYTYSSPTNTWLHYGEISVAIVHTCTITLPTGEMMVNGGQTEGTLYSPLVYKARPKVQ